MKIKIFTIITFLFLSLWSFGQSVVLNGESTFSGWDATAENHKAYDLAYCWNMTTNISYVSAGKISGLFSIRTPSLNNNPPVWVSSPWLSPASGNITMQAKMTGTNGVKNRSMSFYYIPYSASDPNFEGTPQLFHTHNFAVTTNVVNISVPMPAAIVGNGILYKIQISFTGSGGNHGIIFDDWTLPASYRSDPSDCGGDPLLADADGDGVPDIEDAYPNDAAKSYDIYVPATGYGTWMFEDMWPGLGDYDLNDLVVAFRHHLVTDASNMLVSLNSTLRVKAVGAERRNGFAFQLDGVAPSDVLSVSGVDALNPDWWSLAPNGTENGQTDANVLVFDDAVRVLPPPGDEYSNTVLAEPYVSPVTYQVQVQFAPGEVAYGGGLPINPYIIIQQDRGKETHLPGRVPSSLANPAYFGTEDDNTQPSLGIYYKSDTNLPWGLEIPKEIPHGQEYLDIIFGYLKLAPWAQSNGESFPDWYEDLPGYRDNSKLYIR